MNKRKVMQYLTRKFPLIQGSMILSHIEDLIAFRIFKFFVTVFNHTMNLLMLG